MSNVENEPGFFQQLEQHASVLSPPANLGLKRDRWLLGTVGVGIVLAFLSFGRMIGSVWAPWITLAGLSMQLVGFSVFTYRQVRDTVPDFVDAKRKFAIEMDEHFFQRAQVLQWLRSVPAAERAARLAYAEARLEALRSRFPLIFGAVDKVGILPVAVGVFIQFQATKSISLLVMVIGIGVVVLYGMALWVSRFRLQLEGYSRLIRAADDVTTDAE